MNFTGLTAQQMQVYSNLMFEPLNSVDEIRDWIKLYLELEIPIEITDPDSTSSPLDAIWQIYQVFKNNSGDVTPGAILMSCREGMKTVSVSLLEILLLLHFQLDIAHAAAVESQSSVGIKYIESFMFKIEPLVKLRGWQNLTQNKRTIAYKTPEGKTPYIKVLICTPKGMNSLHANVLFLDELDLADASALKEAKNIVGYSKGIYGMTVYLSTRKYAFGNMNAALDKAEEMQYKVLQWNILDVTERCPPTRHLADEPKVERYIAKNLPLLQISKEQFDALPPTEHPKYELLKDVHAGCLKCPLLPVCKMRLSQKPLSASGGFYKPIQAVIQKFRENDPDTAEAQLMCFSEKTQILMSDGSAKDIKDVMVGDKVITHKGNSRKVIDTFKRLHSGPAYKVKNTNWKHLENTVVTSEHPYFVNGKEFVSIKDVKTHEFDNWGGTKKKGDYFSLPVAYEISQSDKIYYRDYVSKSVVGEENRVKLKLSRGDKTVPAEYALTEKFGWILGYFLAEGFIIKKLGRPIGITFCSHVKEEHLHQKIRDFASSLNLTVSEFKCVKGNGYTVDIYNSALAELFLILCNQHSDKKRLHFNLMNANLDFLGGILSGHYDGDGTKRINSYKELTTTSYVLASQLFTIAARFGLCPRLTRKPPASGRKKAYLVHYTNSEHVYKQKRTRFLNQNGHNQYRVDSLEKTSFEGYVYNFEVEEDHSYIANGVSVHNCWKPGSEGLVFPRFKKEENLKEPNKTNVISVAEAYFQITGKRNSHVSEEILLKTMQAAGIEFFAGVDWGFTHDAVITIVARLPDGQIWVIDCFASPGLEFSDMLETGMKFRDRYFPQKWYCDPAYPANVKSFNGNGMRSPKFSKDVAAGVEAVRSKITNASGKRLFKVVKTPTTLKLIESMSKHRFLLDGAGNPTAKPDDEPQVADICDTLRYIGENLFPVKGTKKPLHAITGPDGKPLDGSTEEGRKELAKQQVNNQMMMDEIARHVQDTNTNVGGSGRKGGFHFSF